MSEELKQFGKLAGGALLLGLLWKFPGKFAQDAVLWGFFLYAVFRGGAYWRVWTTSFGWTTLAIVAFVLISAPMGVDPAASFRLLMKKADIVAACAALPVVFHTRRSMSMLLWCVMLALSVVLIGELARIVSVFGMEAMSKARWADSAVFSHHNIGAMAGAVCLILLIYAGLTGRGRPAVWVSCLLAGLALIAYEIIIASRGAQIALLVALMVFLLMALTGRHRYAVLLLVVVGACFPLMNPRFPDSGRTGMLVERDKAWRHTWELIIAKPVLGYGYGEPVFQKVYHESNPPRSPHKFFHPHNYWLNVMFIGGGGLTVLHVLLWTLGLSGLWRRVTKCPDFDQRLFPGAVAALIVCILVYGLADTPNNVVSMMLMLTVPATALLVSEKQST